MNDADRLRYLTHSAAGTYAAIDGTRALLQRQIERGEEVDLAKLVRTLERHAMSVHGLSLRARGSDSAADQLDAERIAHWKADRGAT
jgi:hypothetical protein